MFYSAKNAARQVVSSAKSQSFNFIAKIAAALENNPLAAPLLILSVLPTIAQAASQAMLGEGDIFTTGGDETCRRTHCYPPM